MTAEATGRIAWTRLAPLLAVAAGIPLLATADPLGRETPRLLGLQAGLLLVLLAGPFAAPRPRGAPLVTWAFPLAWFLLFVLGGRDVASLDAGLPLLFAAGLAVSAASIRPDRRAVLALGFAVVLPAMALALLGLADGATGGSGVATLGNPNRVGEFVAATLPVAAAFFLLPRHRGLVAFGLVAVLLLLGHAVICKSRGGLLVGAVELVLFAGLAGRLSRRGRIAGAPWRRLGGLAGAILLGVGLLWMLPATRGHLAHAVERVSQGLSPEYPANRVRFGLARATVRLVGAHPLGVGHGGFREAFVRFRDPVEQRTSGWRSTVTHAHDQYLHTAAETGIAGGLLLAALLVLTAARLLRRIAVSEVPDVAQRAVRTTAAVGLLGAAVGSLVSTPLLNPAALSDLALLGGLGVGAIRPVRPAPSSRTNRIARAIAVLAVALSLFLTIPAFRSYLHRIEARDALAAGNAGATLAAWQAAAAATPQDAEVWQRVAFVQNKLDRPKAALESLAKALAVRPDFVACLLVRGDLLAKLGRFPEAVEPVTRATELQPGNPEPFLMLGKILAASGNEEGANTAFRRAIRADRGAFRGDPASYVPSGPALEAREALVGELMAKAERITTSRGRTEAARVYREILEIDPRHPEANLRLGAELRREGREEEAARHRYVGELESGLHWLREALRVEREGNAAGAGPRFEQAVRRLTLATFADARRFEPYYYLAVVHALRDRPGAPHHDREMARARLDEARRHGLVRLEEAPGEAAYREAVRPYWSP